MEFFGCSGNKSGPGTPLKYQNIVFNRRSLLKSNLINFFLSFTESQRVTDMVCKIRKAEVGSIKVRSNVYITIILSFKQIDNMHAFDPFAHRDDR